MIELKEIDPQRVAEDLLAGSLAAHGYTVKQEPLRRGVTVLNGSGARILVVCRVREDDGARLWFYAGTAPLFIADRPLGPADQLMDVMVAVKGLLVG